MSHRSDKFDYPLTDVIAKLPDIVPFVGAETSERQMGQQFGARIGANENGFGPSPNAIAAMQDGACDIWMYGDAESYDLRMALAKFHDVHFENIVVGEGIDALLGYTCRLFLQPGRTVVTTQGAYPTFNFHATANGAQLHFVPMNNDHEDTGSLIAKAKSVNATLIYMSNPNNPMGSCHDGRQVQQFIDQVPTGAILVLDEAYIDFAPEGSAAPIDIQNPNVLRYRTFSKAYGMAGARIGYCIGEAALIANFEKVRNHFGMNRTAQIGALAALEDQEYLRTIIKKIAEGRVNLARIAQTHAMSVLPSATNFIAIDCQRDESFARAIVEKLMQRGVQIRMPAIAPQSRCIRVSIGDEAAMDIFEEALAATLAELG